MTTSARPLLASMVTDVYTNSLAGHPYETCLSVQEAAAIAGWDHVAAVPVSCPVSPLPDGWSPCLHYKLLPDDRSGLLRDALQVLPLALEITAFMRRSLLTTQRPVVVYYEWFKPPTLAAFTIGVMLTHPRDLTVWLCFKGRVDQRPGHALYRLFTRILSARLGAERLRVFTDNERVIPHLSDWLGIPVHPVPIPHTSDQHPNQSPAWQEEVRRTSQAACWWPGNPTAAKGLPIVRALTQSIVPGAEQLCVIAAEASGFTQVAGGCRVVLVPNELSHDDYRATLFASDVVLLPYQSAHYQFRTSGIFVEAVVAGKLPLASVGTWPAEELQMHHLDELVIDWQRSDLPAEIVRLAGAPEVRRKLDIMTTAYRAYHSPAGFAEMLREI